MMPAAAAHSFEQAAALGVPAQLAEETQALHIESLSRAGDRAQAQVEFERFRNRFPTSVWLPDLKKRVVDR